MHIGICEKCSLFSDLIESWTSSTDFRKVLISNFLRILQVGAELFYEELRTDGQTQSRHDEANSRFRNFAKAPKRIKI
jgi:hypothetical protein